MVSREEDAVSLELADRALGFALTAGAAEAEAVIMTEDGALTRFANSEIHQNVAQREVAVNLRVVIGKRVSSTATAGEVLVSRTVADLVAGSDIELHDKGEHELKGVSGTWRLFSVASA